MARSDALIFSGRIIDHAEIEDFNIMRKPVTPAALSNIDGDYVLTLKSANGSTLYEAPFHAYLAADHSATLTNRSAGFTVITPFHEDVALLEITYKDRVLLSKERSTHAPSIEITKPSSEEVWKDGKAQIAWKAEDQDDDPVRVFIQYSPDLGKSWHPIAYLSAEREEHEFAISELPPSTFGQFYMSASDGFNTVATLTEMRIVIDPNSQLDEADDRGQ